jgi:prolyl-tRNA editing enzyme YbaK/EbsC (Cys-tRNA(Pro) deacylase)
MSLQSVREFLAQHAPDVEILEKQTSTATVAEAAEAFGVEPGQIAKTLSLWLRDEVVLLVMGGDARIDNRKYKEQIGGKARMLSAEEVLEWTSHPVGGVCPFGLAHPLRVFLDQSVRRFSVVLPAAGATNAAVRISPDRLAQLVKAEWVDVTQRPAL